MRRFLPSLLAALLIAGCAHTDESGPSGKSAPSSPARPALAWEPCPWEGDFLRAIGTERAAQFQHGFELGCASVTVPQDHDKADGQTMRVALSRTRSKDAGGKNRPPLLVNFGGPGQPGVREAAAMALRAENDLAAHFDVIGFDPRGVGESEPVVCGPDPAQEAKQQVLDPRDPAQLAKLRARVAAVAQDCEAKYGSKLAAINTYQTAQDIDSIRVALGAQRIDYLGYSYGTFLGAAYAHLHPRQIRAAVFDSPVDLRRDPVKTEEEAVQAKEKAFDSFFDWTKTQPSYADLASARGFLGQGLLDPGAGQLLAGISTLLSSPAKWPDLAEGLRSVMSTGDSAALRKADPGFSMANWTVLCDDLPQDRRPDDAAVRSLASQWAQKYPTFGLYELGYGNGLVTGCAGWPAPAHPVTSDFIDRAAPPAGGAPGPKPLVVSGETDPTTPLAWAAPFTEAVGGVLLVTAEPGHGHYLRGGARRAPENGAAEKNCVDAAVDDYLVTGTLPPESSRCPV
ncbi:alpha/beta fold hydrolase [Segniliparus rotundus]|nr:alpha/beta fold hydrolase [Segniliparus rotundus]